MEAFITGAVVSASVFVLVLFVVDVAQEPKDFWKLVTSLVCVLFLFWAVGSIAKLSGVR